MPKQQDLNNNNTSSSEEERSIVINHSLGREHDETRPLLTSPTKVASGFGFFDGVKFLRRACEGAAKTYGGFRPFAIRYRSGYWLLGPVGAGFVIEISAEMFKHLKSKFPDNPVIIAMEKMTHTASDWIVETSKDFGFNFVLAQFIWQYFASNAEVAQTGTWASTGGLTALMFASRQRSDVRGLMMMNRMVSFAHSFQIPIDVGQDQNIIPKHIIIPLAIASGLGVMGLTTGYLKKNHPKVALVLQTLVDTFCNNPSLFILILALCNDLYAADHHNELSVAYFYSVLAVSILCLGVFTVSTPHDALCEWRALSKTEDTPTQESERDSMRELNEEDFQDWQVSSDSQPDSDSEASFYTP